MQGKRLLVRQGDVVFKPIASIPNGKRVKRENGIIAYGEATGHTHAVAELAAADVIEIDGKVYVGVLSEEGVSIIHQEHGEVRVPKGDWEISIQREYSPEAIRNVVD